VVVERSRRQSQQGGIESDITRTDPPPKHKSKQFAQRFDIAADFVAAQETSREPSARERKSASGRPGIVKAGPRSEELARLRAMGGSS